MPRQSTSIIVVIFALICAFNAFAQEVELPGEGTLASPYLIANSDQLRMIEKAPNACYRLDANIKLDSPWTPLCRETPFTGSLDGAGLEISGLDVAPDAADGTLGLFAQIADPGRVSDFELKGRVRVGQKSRCAGGVVGTLRGGLVSEATVDVEIQIDGATPEDVAIGGIAGESFGVVFYCAFNGELQDKRSPILFGLITRRLSAPRENKTPPVGAIVGRQIDRTVCSALTQLITAQAGFGAPGGPSDKSQDNTIDNIVDALRRHPDVIEVDVQLNDQGVLVVTHNKPKDSDPTLETVLRALMGERPSGYGANKDDLLTGGSLSFPEVDAKIVRIQLDAKRDGLFVQELELLDKLNFPYDRVIMAGDSTYNTVLANKELIRAAVERGLDFWMNPDRLDSYDALAAKSESFLERVRALELPRMTINSYYGAITPDVAEWLAANGLDVSVWTLNDEKSLRNNMTRGFKNVTSRLPLAVEMRNCCAFSGIYGSWFNRSLPEKGGERIIMSRAISPPYVPNATSVKPSRPGATNPTKSND